MLAIAVSECGKECDEREDDNENHLVAPGLYTFVEDVDEWHKKKQSDPHFDIPSIHEGGKIQYLFYRGKYRNWVTGKKVSEQQRNDAEKYIGYQYAPYA